MLPILFGAAAVAAPHVHRHTHKLINQLSNQLAQHPWVQQQVSGLIQEGITRAPMYIVDTIKGRR